jgi:alkanesulfonate monooxygenase SsuD/methylene tetrahydromethanopterin reductase-like flavin-dependent oxidoreductase (luciferase family)
MARHEGGKAMKFGAGFALTAQADPIALRDMAQTLDGAGFDYVTTAGHLLSAPPDVTGAPSLQRIIEARQALAAAGY